MSLRFRQSVKLFPGVRLNFSASGISTTIGVQGASMNIGSRGSYMNLGLPGTGVSYRGRISPDASSERGAPQPRPVPARATLPVPAFPERPAYTPLPDVGPQPGEIRSASVSSLTSPGLGELKRLINEATATRRALEGRVSADEQKLADTRRRLESAERFVVRVFMQGRLPSLAASVDNVKATLELARQELAACSISVEFDFDQPTLDAFAALVRAFHDLRGSHRIWDITASVATDRFVERTTAIQSVSRTPVRFEFGTSPVIETKYGALHLGNANGGDLYVYPGYAMMRNRGHDFALIDIRELEVRLRRSRFIEEETVPGDTRQIDITWKKANKDGSPDRRFANNYQIPVVEYGELWFRSGTGLNECYMVSSFPTAEAFVLALKTYQEAVSAMSRQMKSPPPADEAVGSGEADNVQAEEAPAAPAYRCPSLAADYAAIAGAVLLLAGGVGFWWAPQHGVVTPIAATSTAATGQAAGAPTSIASAAVLPSASTPARDHVFIQKPGVNVRAEPSSTAKIVAVEKLGKEFSVYAKQGEWVQVGGEAPVGWVHSSLVGTKAP